MVLSSSSQLFLFPANYPVISLLFFFSSFLLSLLFFFSGRGPLLLLLLLLRPFLVLGILKYGITQTWGNSSMESPRLAQLPGKTQVWTPRTRGCSRMASARAGPLGPGKWSMILAVYESGHPSAALSRQGVSGGDTQVWHPPKLMIPQVCESSTYSSRQGVRHMVPASSKDVASAPPGDTQV